MWVVLISIRADAVQCVMKIDEIIETQNSTPEKNEISISLYYDNVSPNRKLVNIIKTYSLYYFNQHANKYWVKSTKLCLDEENYSANMSTKKLRLKKG